MTSQTSVICWYCLISQDCSINILGLNTHLHHADFDRNAGEGYKFNYIHCKCTSREKTFLKNELKAEFEDPEGVVT